MNRRSLLESLGFSLLLVLPFIGSLLVPGSTTLFHHRFAFQKSLGGVLLDIGLFFLLGVAGCWAVRRLPQFPRTIVTGFLCGLVFWWSLFTLISILISLPSFTGESSLDKAFLVAQVRLLGLNSLVPMIFAGAAVIWPDWAKGFAKAIRLVLAGFSFCGLWMIPQIAFIAFYLHPITEFDRSGAAATSPHDRRIIWILFDELSYKLAFESPPKGLELPNFKTLASQSSSFGNVQPPAYYTDRIVPAVLSDKPIDHIKSDWTGNLLFHEQGRSGWQPYNPNLTVFGKARDAGWNPGVAGWYNPYCRIFASVLTTCFWQPGTPSTTPFERLGASRKASLIQNALIIPRFFVELFSGFGGTTIVEEQDQSKVHYENMMAESQKLIQNGKLRFVFLHLPVPHPPGFFDRNTHQLCRCGNYLDNLVLADDTLGALRQEIDKSPWAQQTTLIVSSDHSWRVHMWSARSGFTPEEAAVSQGVYEPRPVFLVHFPQQTVPAQFPKQFSEVDEFEIISSMLNGGVNNPEELRALVDQGQRSSGK